MPDDNNVQNNGFIGATVALLGSLTAGFIGYKMYKRKQTVRQWKQTQKHYHKDDSLHKPDEQSPSSPKETKVAVNPLTHIFQTQEHQRTMHSPIHVKKVLRQPSMQRNNYQEQLSMYSNKQHFKKIVRPKSIFAEKIIESVEQ